MWLTKRRQRTSKNSMVKLRYRGSRVNFLEDQVSRSNSSSSSTTNHLDTNSRSSEGRRQSEASGVERIRYRGHFLKSSSSSIQEEEEEIVNKICNPNPTRIILSKKGEKYGILWIIMSIVPIFILYKLSTNSLIANLGKGGGSRSSRDPTTKMLQKMLFKLSMKKQQEDMLLLKEYRFMKAIEDDICHDYPPTLDIMSTVPVVVHQQKHN